MTDTQWSSPKHCPASSFRVSLWPPVQLVVPETIRNKNAKYRASGRVCPLEEPLGRSGARGGGQECGGTQGAVTHEPAWKGELCPHSPWGRSLGIPLEGFPLSR